MSVSVPIHSLEELKSWKIVTSRSKLEVGEQCFVAWESGVLKDCMHKNVPKTLICHDMKGKAIQICSMLNSDLILHCL